MNIAIYYPWIYLRSGIERTILETVKRSKHKYTIFTNHFDSKATFPEYKSLKVVKLKRISVRRDLFSVFGAAITILGQKVDLSKFDALIVHSEGLGDLFLARNNQIPTYCYCHTPLRPVFDPEYKKRAFPRRGKLSKLAYTLFENSFKYLDRFLWLKYKHVFFNSSESYKRAFRGGLIKRKSSYEVLHPGIDWGKIKPRGKYDKIFLVPGRIMWTKNIELAIESYKLFKARDTNDFKLIIAGHLDVKSKPYLNYLKRITKNDPGISFVINPSDNKMEDLYNNCYAVICPAFNEDWGLTAIEANAYSKAVLAVNAGGFKESQIDKRTGYLLAPITKSISKKMSLLAKKTSLATKMGRFARTNAKQYSWEEFIKRLDNFLTASSAKFNT